MKARIAWSDAFLATTVNFIAVAIMQPGLAVASRGNLRELPADDRIPQNQQRSNRYIVHIHRSVTHSQQISDSRILYFC